MKKIRIERLTDFKKDFKKLVKKFRTLEEYLQTFIQYQLNLFHFMNQDSNGIKRISDLGIKKPEIYKARKFACKLLKGRGGKSGIRIIYAYFKDEDRRLNSLRFTSRVTHHQRTETVSENFMVNSQCNKGNLNLITTYQPF